MQSIKVSGIIGLESLVDQIMADPGACSTCDFREPPKWAQDFNLTKLVLVKFPMEIGPTGNGWYAAASGYGDPQLREWYVKALTLEWAICAGALLANKIEVVYGGDPLPHEPLL